MKTVIDHVISKNPIQVPEESDVAELQARREKLAREIESQEALNKAKENPDFQKIVLDSYQSMQMIERAAILLNPHKESFSLTFAGLQGRWRERLTLTEELTNGQRTIRQKKTLLKGLVERIEAMCAKLRLTRKP